MPNCALLIVQEVRFVYRLLDNETAADVLMEMDEDVRKEFLEDSWLETIAKRFVDYMDTDDAVDLMRELDEKEKQEEILYIEYIEQAGDIVDLLKYDEDTAGGLMVLKWWSRRRTEDAGVPERDAPAS